jgi:2-keto-4-pentenoate hydratase/2-oxohepta-3-ene-1,7-dioic acid hydratase in catechol pathway
MKIICIGRNYSEHVKELNSLIPSEPVFFMKPDSALLLGDKPFFLPEFSKEIHHEIELVVKINRIGKHIEKQFANRYYNEITAGIDFTARDLQNKCRKEGNPWEIAKAFDGSAVLGKFLSLSLYKDINNISFHLKVNNKIVQQGTTADMLFNVDTIISYTSQFVTLKIGDIIYTGTPKGVGCVNVNDHLEGFIEDRKVFDFEVK